MNSCTSHIIIPARLASTGLPRRVALGQTGRLGVGGRFHAGRQAVEEDAGDGCRVCFRWVACGSRPTETVY